MDPFFFFFLAFLLIPEDRPMPEGSREGKEEYRDLNTRKDCSKPDLDLFLNGLEGYQELKNEGKVEKRVLTMIDMRLSSNKRRLWTIDMKADSVLFQTLVAHGKATGNEYAENFSNEPGSHKTSLGFYVTGGTYYGKHGLSLYLDGVEQGINDNARSRAIVLHGAAYVSKRFGEKYGRTGRSFGCPAVPKDIHEPLIQRIKEKSCLFIYHSQKDYVQRSGYLD